MAKKKIELLASKLAITNVGKGEVLQALQNKKVNDFEDGLEFYAAAANKYQIIITEYLNDFHFPDLKVQNAQDFLVEYSL